MWSLSEARGGPRGALRLAMSPRWAVMRGLIFGLLLCLLAGLGARRSAHAAEPEVVGSGAGQGAASSGGNVLPGAASLSPRSASEALEPWLLEGDDRPAEILVRLQERRLSLHGSAGPGRLGDLALTANELAGFEWRRALRRSRGWVAARSGMESEWREAMDALQQLALEEPARARHLEGDMALLQAQWHEQVGRHDLALEQVRLADQAYAEACGEKPSLRPGDCDLRAWWRALHLGWQHTDGQGQGQGLEPWGEARAWARRSAQLAERAGAVLLQARALAGLAVLSQAAGEPAPVAGLMAQAELLVQGQPEQQGLIWLRYDQARLALLRDDKPLAVRRLREALRMAGALHSPRMEAGLEAALADAWRRNGQPREALAAIERALPVARRLHEPSLLAQLLHLRGLVCLVLGPPGAGKADLDAALLIWQKASNQAAMEMALREASDGLASIGDLRGALELYHREQALRVEIHRASREAAVAQMRSRFRSASEVRELGLLERENALHSSRLANQALLERLWILAVVLLVLAAGVAGMLLLRSRDANRRLQRSAALLRVQSERDALTGLANRRHFRDVLATQLGASGFRGALLLLDVDHFKRINDERGHLVGDQVLTELAQRLENTVRMNDLVCRWGGEEFLIYARQRQGEGLAALALRMLQAVGDEPIELGSEGALPVTVSIGYACFPLPGQEVALGWEQAVNLVDMALYTAKSMGRDRAVGLLSLHASDQAGLQEVERDFELARLAGDVSLRVDARPATPSTTLAGAAAAG